MDQSIVFQFFGGVLQDGLSWAVDYDKVLYELARWLLPIGICLLAEGVRLEKRRNIERLSCYRYEAMRIWWRHKFARSLLYGIASAAVLFLIVVLVDIVNAGGIHDEIWKVFVLWIAHMTTILSFLLLLDLSGLGKFAPAILILLEGCTFLAGVASMRTARFMFGMWGMYFQSKWYFGEGGVSVLPSLITEGGLIMLAYLSGGILLKKAVQKSIVCF
ncbi:hypothetical protein D7V94_16965 [Parablautia intestinalis]|uniref:Uncharacterized protein n=1 Tax=Parablautia intestinalis TaxID=2320100 RepID=A0A3A9ADE2_9FIRM|nr:hypothetical protein [Parablautia intestinalis]RKI89660.1 hypothetical protein D7V94_16965 [Parablautia intestinalis]